MVQSAAIEACDAADGVKDGIIADPTRCKFDPGALLCKAGNTESCLTEPQIAALRKIYSGPRNSKTGKQINYGLQPGVESLFAGFSPAPGTPRALGLADLYFIGMLFENPKWESKSLNFDSDVDLAETKVGFLNATNPDLNRFKAHGGKLIQYHGWSDQGVPPMTSVAYYESVIARSGGQKQTDGFFRLFMAPGMNHCFGGPGPNSFGNVIAPAPLQSSAETDIQKSIEGWVEHGVAPGRIVASKFVGDDPKKGVAMTRPLCRYPELAIWAGKGSTDEAANFVCKPAKNIPKGKSSGKTGAE
jgi:feruloyl esterase